MTRMSLLVSRGFCYRGRGVQGRSRTGSRSVENDAHRAVRRLIVSNLPRPCRVRDNRRADVPRALRLTIPATFVRFAPVSAWGQFPSVGCIPRTRLKAPDGTLGLFWYYFCRPLGVDVG